MQDPSEKIRTNYTAKESLCWSPRFRCDTPLPRSYNEPSGRPSRRGCVVGKVRIASFARQARAIHPRLWGKAGHFHILPQRLRKRHRDRNQDWLPPVRCKRVITPYIVRRVNDSLYSALSDSVHTHTNHCLNVMMF